MIQPIYNKKIDVMFEKYDDNFDGNLDEAGFDLAFKFMNFF